MGICYLSVSYCNISTNLGKKKIEYNSTINSVNVNEI